MDLKPPALEPGDYYYDGPNIVFTAAYHLKRGSCCGSGCRHCPYRDADAESGTASAPAGGDFHSQD
jgi:hypothetical protein